MKCVYEGCPNDLVEPGNYCGLHSSGYIKTETTIRFAPAPSSGESSFGEAGPAPDMLWNDTPEGAGKDWDKI